MTSSPSRSLVLALVVHSHQPVGNFDDVMARAFQQAYEPFVRCLARHPAIRITLHMTGHLLDWLCGHRPSFVEALRRLTRRGQIEWLGGGDYEPILTVIPATDGVQQIRRLRERVRRLFDVTPRGAWLAERVWEPRLARTLAEAGVEYTVMDENHFTQAGLPHERLGGLVLTEEEGYGVKLFPASESLRYTIPFKEPEETIHVLEEAYRQGWHVITYADDGEKFGLWPHTADWVYTRGWLDRFFTTLEQQGDWLQTQTLGAVVDAQPVRERWYLPCASYREMLEWSGGYFRNFFVKYPEANALHKRMLQVSGRLAEVAGALAAGGARATARRRVLGTAYQHLYMAQCNDAYWHGIFGGLYLHHLREAVYCHLIEAERLADEAVGAWRAKTVRVTARDFDLDGRTEIMIATAEQTMFIDPAEGGAVTELDVRRVGWNLVNTLARRQESYHHATPAVSTASVAAPGQPPLSIHSVLGAKEEGLTDRLVYDAHRRAAWIEHLLPPDLEPETFWRGRYAEWGDFAGQPFAWRLTGGAARRTVVLERRGEAVTEHGVWPVALTKAFTIPVSGTTVDVRYRLTNAAQRPLQALFAVECNASVYDPRYATAPGRAEPGPRLEIHDQWTGRRLVQEVAPVPTLWHSPIHTVSESEEGLERTYQELCWLLVWPLWLEAGAQWTASIRHAVVLGPEECAGG